MEHDVFISYSSKEKSVADGVCHYLEDNGVKCWMAPRDIPVGTDYGDLIDEAIKSCRVVVLVYSQHSFISKWVKGEINVAFDEGKPIAPFRIDETGIKGAFRVMLNQMHWIDAYPSYADRLPDLLSSICGFIGREVPEHQPPVTTDSEEPTVAAGSEEHFLKVRCTLDCRLFIDRDECANIKAGDIIKIPLHQGEYLVQVTSLDGLDTMEQELDMPAADKLLFFDLLALQKERLAVEQQLKEEAERKAKAEEERKKQAEAERRAKEEAERRAKEEAERKAHEEAARKAKAEEERKKQEEAERKAKEEAARKAKEEAERRAKEEAERRAKEEAERRAKEEAERRAKEDAERKAKEEAERRAKEEAERRAKEEAERKAKEEAERKVREMDEEYRRKGYVFVGEAGKVIKKSDIPQGAKYIRIVDGADYYYWDGDNWINPFKKNKDVVSVVVPPHMSVSIPSGSFEKCKNLESVIFLGVPSRIEFFAFAGCKSLKTIIIPNGVKHIWNFAFDNCINLTEIVIPKSVESIGNYAFYNCINLTEIVIPKSVESIGDNAFNWNTFKDGLKKVRLLNPNTKYTQSGYFKRTFNSETEIILG